MSLEMVMSGCRIRWTTDRPPSELVDDVSKHIVSLAGRLDREINPASKVRGFVGQSSSGRLRLVPVPGQSNPFRWTIDLSISPSVAGTVLEGHAGPSPVAWITLVLGPVITVVLVHEQLGLAISAVASTVLAVMFSLFSFVARREGQRGLALLQEVTGAREASTGGASHPT